MACERQSPQVSNRSYHRTIHGAAMSHQVPAGTYFDLIVFATFLFGRISRMLKTCLRYRTTDYLVVNES